MISSFLARFFILLFVLNCNLLAYEEKREAVTPISELDKKMSDDDEVNQGNKKLEEYVLDGRYRGGRNLIYDCERGHYACVDDSSKENCNFRRTKQEMHRKQNLSCAFFKTFLNKKDCLLEQYKIMEKKPKTIFCFKKYL